MSVLYIFQRSGLVDPRGPFFQRAYFFLVKAIIDLAVGRDKERSFGGEAVSDEFQVSLLKIFFMP